jgi:deoxyadenosine/deoxycytidine kinase
MYIVEGNIGAGKSTFLRLIQEQLPHIAVVFEPLHNWQSQVYGQSILSNFYKEPHRWAYTMETLAMACRVQEHLKEQEHPNSLRLMERSIYSGHYAFASNGYKNGFMTEIEWHVYLEWFNFLVTGHCKPPHGFIYLNVDPEVAFERIKKRNRPSEKNISLQYIKQIHACHEAFLVEKKGVLAELKATPVLVLNCNKEFEADHSQFLAHAQSVADFMHAGELARQTSFTTFNIAEY